jgi:tetratricopeptide (TPR) repeat protein/TolB-like protein
MSVEGLFKRIQRRRLPHWLVVYAATSWGCLEATGFAIENFGAPERLLDVVLFLLLVFLPVVIILTWYHGERGPQRPTRVEGALLGSLLCIAIVGAVWIASTGSPLDASVPDDVIAVDMGERSLAVLPFRSTVEDPGLEWLDRGIAELLSTKLAQIDDLRVVSSQRLVDLLTQLGVQPRGAVPDEIAPVLMELSGARLVVTGSVFGQPGDVTITAELVEVSSGHIRASASARGADVIALVDEIAVRLRAGIDPAGVHAELASVATLTTSSVDAYRAYDEGRRASQRFLNAEAAAHYGRALELDPSFALARFRRALSLYQLGSISEAAAEIRRARLDLGPASERDRLFVTAVDQFATDTAAAVATVRELVRKYPDDKDARIIFASQLAGLRGAADPEARALLHETLKLDPRYAPGYNILAYSYAGSGDLEAADSLTARYVELEPDQPNSWDSRGEILELSGRVEEAREAYRQALRVRPDFRFSINHLVRSYLDEDDPEGARLELAAFHESALPEVRIRATALEGDTYLWEGAVDDAVAAYESAERGTEAAGLTGLQVWRLRDLVQIRLALGEYAAAIEAAEQVRSLEPLDGWWITAIYDSLASTGDAAELERARRRVEADVAADSLAAPNRLDVISRLIDLWIAHAEGEHQASRWVRPTRCFVRSGRSESPSCSRAGRASSRFAYAGPSTSRHAPTKRRGIPWPPSPPTRPSCARWRMGSRAFPPSPTFLIGWRASPPPPALCASDRRAAVKGDRRPGHPPL